MSKLIKILIISIIASLMLASCSGRTNADIEKLDHNKKTVTVTTSFLEDMVYQLAGDLVNIRLLIPAGEDPHLYIAKPRDLDKLMDTDLVLYHGLHFEGKLAFALESIGKAVSSDFTPSELGVMDDDGDEVVDPHFWFDIKLYKKAVQTASLEMIKLLPEHREIIEQNTKIYLMELDRLNISLKEDMDSILVERRFLITPHDAFNYFSRQFNIPVMAPQGIGTDSEVANKDIEETVDFIVRHKIKAVFVESTSDPARMEKLKEACRHKGHDIIVVSGEGRELFSDSLGPKGSVGDTYIDMYKHNVQLIVENLN
ncbi:MAG: zinc ABC transporter solute-binding protein [Tissierellia bacterium]|nr:zinc ABC transporter solute-binding protein [Tissierellia bacterium]